MGSVRQTTQIFLKKLNEIAYFKMVKSELHLFDAKDKLIMLAIAEKASE